MAPKKLTREQNLELRLNVARRLAEEVLIKLAIELVTAYRSEDKARINEMLRMQADLVADLRIEDANKVRDTAMALAGSYVGKVSEQRNKRNDLVSSIRSVLDNRDLSHDDEFSALNNVFSHSSWSDQVRDVETPVYPDPDKL